VDVVGDLLSSMRLSGGVIIDARMHGEFSLISEVSAADWAPYFPVTGPIISYHFVRSGELWAEVDGLLATKLGPGAIVMFPQNRRHRLYNADVETVLARDVITPPSSSEPVQVTISGEGQPTQLYCGFLSATGDSHPLLEMLPPMMVVDPRKGSRSEWIASSLRFAAEELRSLPPLFLGRVAELMFSDAVRAFVDDEGSDSSWMKGMRDPAVARALAVIHRRFAEELDVEGLARQAGVSRSVLGERFGALMGEPPMRYVSRVRLKEAAALLRERRQSAASIGYAVGFNSEVAFSRAFKRQFGEPPAAWAKRVR
jgi:AraC-like DNA-binding protein